MIMNEYIISKKKNKELIQLLTLDPVFQVYSLYVCETKPEEESVVAINKESQLIEAILVTGMPDLFVAGGYYLTGINDESTRAILDTIKKESNTYISYPIYLDNAVRSVFPHGEFSTDCIHVYNESNEHKEIKNDSLFDSTAVEHLTREIFERLEVDDIFYEKVTPNDLDPISKFYCVIVDNKLVAIGEHELENSASCGISQVYTLEEYRGKGYASSIIRHIAEIIKSNYKIPVYHFSMTNIASRKACERASFMDCIKLGYVEI